MDYTFWNSPLLRKELAFPVLAAEHFEERRRMGDSAVLGVGVRVVVVVVVAEAVLVVVVVSRIAMAARRAAVVRFIEG